MSRNLTTANTTEATAAITRPVIFVELDFDSGIVRANTTDRAIVWGGQTYYGVGNLGGIDKVSEDVSMGSNGISISLSGVDTNMLAIALGEQYQGRTAVISLGFVDSSYAVVDTPVTVFSGLMDVMTIQSGENSGTISLSCENRMSRWDIPSALRFNDSTQKLFFPDDKGFEYVEQAAQTQIFWGRSPDVGSTSPTTSASIGGTLVRV